MKTPGLYRKSNLTALLFLTPSLAGFCIFFFLPFLAGLYYSLVDSPVNGSFTGMTNYINLLGNPVFQKAGINTLVFTVLCVPLNMLLSLGLAMLLNKNIFYRNAFRTFFISPLVVPVASVVLVWQVIFELNGSLNALLYSLGFNPVDWMKSGWERGVVVMVYLWKNAGYNIVLFLAGLQSIPPEYYESASIDGAGAWRKFRSITLIYLAPASFFILVISILNSFKVFRETYLIAGSYPHDSVYMIQHYMNNMFASLDYQKLTSAAFIMALFIYALVLVLFVTERKITETLG